MERILVLLVAIVLIGQVLAVAEQESVAIEGLRCDSCGMECSSVCGSRAFRTCCFNYIKKRSGDSVPHDQGVKSIDGASKSKSSSSLSRQLRRSASWGPAGELYQYHMPYAVEAQDDRRWYPYLASSTVRLDNGDERSFDDSFL